MGAIYSILIKSSNYYIHNISDIYDYAYNLVAQQHLNINPTQEVCIKRSFLLLYLDVSRHDLLLYYHLVVAGVRLRLLFTLALASVWASVDCLVVGIVAT